MVIPIIAIKKGKPGKRVKTKEDPGLEEVNKAVDEAVEALLEKYNQCHGYKGRFCSSGGGGGGGGSATSEASAGARSSDLPPWMDAKPKPATVTQPATAAPKPTEKPGYTPGKRLPDKTYLPDSDGKYPYPDADHYRGDLKPLVGKEVKMEYWAENKGGKSLTNPNLNTRCIKDIKIDGVAAPIHHVWVQEAGAALTNAQWGQKQEAIGRVTAYAKGKPGQPKKMDYSVQPIRDTINKEMPALDADTILSEMGHLLEKYNQCHGYKGRFCSSGGGSGGGSATAQAGGVQSLDDALAGKPIEEAQPSLMPLENGEVVNLIDNQLGIDQDEATEIARTVDRIAGGAKLEEMHQVTIKQLDPQVLAQCEGSWENGGKPRLWNEVIAVNPQAKDYAMKRYAEDHEKLITSNKMPWLASAYAPTAEAGYKAVLVHEVAHAKCMEHAMKKGTTDAWANKNNPMHGTKGWESLVAKAHAEGWNGPSQYGRKNLGEMFAESVSLLTIRGTTGHKEIDDYVVRVIKE